MTAVAIQDQIPDNDCFGCGPDNAAGLRIKSFWQNNGEVVCRYQPLPHQTAGPAHILNGGIIATLIDCHSICTAMAQAYADEGRPIGSAPTIWCATGRFDLRYLAPTPIDSPVELVARVTETKGKKRVVRCELRSGGATTAEADVVAVHVPDSWRHPAPAVHDAT